MDYNTFRQFADSWGLLYLTVIFMVVIAIVLWPGKTKHYEDMARLPLKGDE